MNIQPIEIRKGIVLFKGRISTNLIREPMVSHTYQHFGEIPYGEYSKLQVGDHETLLDDVVGLVIAQLHQE